jgi:hypothetical protein
MMPRMAAGADGQAITKPAMLTLSPCWRTPLPKFKFEAHKLEEILKEYAKIREVEVPKAVLINGRLLAKELARRTQPFGTKADAGQQRVKNDIGKVIKDSTRVEEMIDKVDDKKIKARLGALFAANNYKVITTIFSNIGFLNKYAGMEFIADPYGPHQENRDPKTGRTRKKGDKLYIAKKDIGAYIEKFSKRVGLSKAGWAVAAEGLPSTVANKRSSYDFPAFVKANMDKASGSAQDNTSNITNPSITLTNSTPWAHMVCPFFETEFAKQVVITRAKAQMAKILKERKKAEEVAD